MIKRMRNGERQLITAGIIYAMERLKEGRWFEVSKRSWTPSSGAFYRSLRLGASYDWFEEGQAVTPNCVAYRLTPYGMAVYDQTVMSGGILVLVRS